jgi:hypothetical protein
MLDLDFWIFTLLHVEIEKGKNPGEKTERIQKRNEKKEEKRLL